MGYRVDKITITLELFVDFGAEHSVTFAYEPGPNDLLAAMAVSKSEEIRIAAEKVGPNNVGIS